MPYQKSLENSANWLILVQNTNGGWGLAQGSATSIVNTAEAICVLTKANNHHYYTSIKNGIDFLERNTLTSVQNQGARTRYVYFALYGILDHLEKVNPQYVNDCIEWLVNAQNTDGGWGHEAKDNNSSLCPTCMTLIVLDKLNQSSRVTSGYNWIKANINDSGKGWSFTKNNVDSVTATSMAILALRTTINQDDEIFKKAKEFLLTADDNSLFTIEAENISGTPWSHCSYMWVFPAYISLGIDPFSPPIAETVRKINRLAINDGWKEPHDHLTIRGQFWVVTALESLKAGYDPSVDTYRIDSYLTGQSRFREPEYVIFNPHGQWSFAVPRTFYTGTAYFLFIISIISFFGIYRKIGLLPRIADFVIAVLFFLIVLFLIKIRKPLFPQKIFLYLFFGLIAVLEGIDLIFGKSVLDLFKMVSDYFKL